MSADLLLANLRSYSVQVVALATVAALAPVLVRLKSPRALLPYWQSVLAACLLLPVLQPWTTAPGGLTSSGAIHVVGGSMAGSGSGAVPLSRVLLFALIAIAGARAVWVALGCCRLRVYRRRAQRLVTADLTRWQSRIGVPAKVYISFDVTGPVTFGLARPVVLLPAGWLALDSQRQQTVFCHELLHVRRRDWLFHLAEEAVRTVLWFHPGIWWVVEEIRLAREQVVDAAVVQLTGARRAYAEALLAFAIPSGDIVAGPAPAFSRKRHLTRRLALIFEEVSMSRSRLFASISAAALSLAFTAAWVVWSFPLVSPQPATAQEPTAQSSDAQPRAISVVQPNYSERARTAGIEGTVLLEVLIGADGHVKNAEIREGLDPDLDENALAAVRQWRFEPGTPDRQPVRTTVQMNFKLDGLGTGVVGGVPGGVIGGVPGGVIGGVPGGVITEVVSASPQDQRVYDAHEKGVTMPKVMSKVDAKYSQAARDAGVEGTVVVYVEVAPDGRAHNMHIERGLHPDLDKNTLDAISNWRFKPATKDGKPVTVHATVETNFRLK